MGKKEYKRWEYEDETEITMEEQLTLEDHCTDTPNGSVSSFSQPTVPLSASPVRNRDVKIKRSRKTVELKEKAQLFGLSVSVLLIGFILGFAIGIRERSLAPTTNNTATNTTLTNSHAHKGKHGKHSHDHHDREGDLSFHKLVGQISGENIRHNLKRISQEEHPAGNKPMASAIRDLWRTIGISVRIEQHKTLLTTTSTFNFVEALDRNGSVIFTTSQIGDDVNLPNAKPFIPFTPPADFSGTLFYGHYGRLEDLQLVVQKTQISLNGSIALIRFGNVHLSMVTAVASKFGVRGIIFYPDPEDFSPLLPANAIHRRSLLTVTQVHDYQKHRGNSSILPCHTIGYGDAEKLLKLTTNGTKAPDKWQGGLNTTYFFGGTHEVHLHINNEQKTHPIYNVVGSIPGASESDRYIIVGCSHDNWAYGAAAPGIGLATMTELVRVFSGAVQSKGWKPRRSILFISWDANLHSSSGLSGWLQEHHFEISTRAIAFIDLSIPLRGNQTLTVYSSPVMREIARKAIARVRHNTGSDNTKGTSSQQAIQFSSVVAVDEASSIFLGGLGVPFIRLCVSNSPKSYDYPMFQTAYDTFDNVVRLLDNNFKSSEAIGRIVAEMILLLADSAVLPINVQDYLKEIQLGFDHFMSEYQEDLHQANLSISYLQAAVMRLEVIGDNFKSQIQNRTHWLSEHGNANGLGADSDDAFPMDHGLPHYRKFRKILFHRILNDKLMELDRSLLSRNSPDGYKHQVIALVPTLFLTSSVADIGIVPNMSNGSFPSNFFLRATNSQSQSKLSPHSLIQIKSMDYLFPKLRQALECGRLRKKGKGLTTDELSHRVNLLNTTAIPTLVPSSSSSTISKLENQINSAIKTSDDDDDEYYLDRPKQWTNVAAQRISLLVRSLHSMSALLQSPLLPSEE